MRPPVLVSVILPTWNRADLVLQALESVLAQTEGDLEALLVDDGSTDDTAARVAARFPSQPRIRVLPKENGGAASARNRGLDEARGEFVAFLDSDDLFLPRHLASQVANLRAHPAADVSICDAVYEGGWKQDGRTVFTRRHFRPPTGLREMLDGAWVLPSQMMVRRARIGDLRFDESFPVCEDIEFLMHLYAEGLGGVLNPEVLTRYRRHGDQAMDDDDAIRLGTIRVLESYAPWAGKVGARRHAYQLARRRATHLARHGRLREARPHLRTWLRHGFSSRALRWWIRSFLGGKDPES